MKIIIGYWTIGCILCGMGQGWHWNDCPNDKAIPFEMITFAATWPAIIGGMVTYKPIGNKTVCEK